MSMQITVENPVLFSFNRSDLSERFGFLHNSIAILDAIEKLSDSMFLMDEDENYLVMIHQPLQVSNSVVFSGQQAIDLTLCELTQLFALEILDGKLP